MTRREWIVKIALSHLGTWYTWGGDDPSGFDCSGLVVECLKSVGTLRRKSDYTAQGLYDMFCEAEWPEKGDLVFWKNANDKVIHVEICLRDMLSIGASGGGRMVRNRKDAILHNAFVKIRRMDSRNGLRWYGNTDEMRS